MCFRSCKDSKGIGEIAGCSWQRERQARREHAADEERDQCDLLEIGQEVRHTRRCGSVATNEGDRAGMKTPALSRVGYCRLKTSTSATPVMLSFPRTTAV